MSEVNTLTIPEEEDIVARAMAEWNAQHVQVLIDDDEIPSDAQYLPLESLIEFLEQQPIPVRVHIAGENYLIRLRKHVPYEEFKEFIYSLSDFLRRGHWVKAEWSREKRAIVVKRWRR
ncbi:hypothetical protein VFC49_06910 [Thermococcus sp. SY098]|uniref:hypothetical protein n=1 Tax=Thermococcus sp. SY098 TaxID=3111325 RepID=UPI002D76F594|nr:hypothetical protein [Thermococcus sp. SY098]WRS51815.1 hypothetical protein VFC49_06910 [Thermococcus sp. SY098]